MRSACCVILFALGIGIVGLAERTEASQPLGTAFTYQGQLLQDGKPTTGTCDLQFILFDAASGGNQVGSVQTVSPVSVTDGLFTVQLNGGGEFGANPFSGDARWLQIGVSCPSSASPSFTVLAPRQDLTAAPYALYASVAGSVSNFTGGLSGDVTGTQSATHVTKINGSSLGSLGGATNGQVLTFNGSNWSPSSVVNSLTAGNGLSVSAATGSITLSVPASAMTNGMLANSSVTVAAGRGLSGGGAVALGGSTTLNNAGVLSVGASAPLASSGGPNPRLSLRGTVPVAHGGTGATTVSAARGNLGAAASGANTDITSLSGITGNIDLPHSTSTSVGTIRKGGVAFMHDFGDNNTFVGVEAGNFSMTGAGNSGLGTGALSVNTAGEHNTAVGISALEENATGSFNNAVGGGALGSNIGSDGCTGLGLTCCGTGYCGNYNNALGYGALYHNTYGSYNDAVGYDALYANTTGSRNTAVGGVALYANTTGSRNTAVGEGVLNNNTLGHDNTAVGFQALVRNDTGWNNIALGDRAGINLLSGSNNIYIGNYDGDYLLGSFDDPPLGHSSGSNNESNTIRIGYPKLQTATYIAGIYNAPSSGVGTPLYVNSDGRLGVNTSSARFKEDIRDMGDSTSALMKLRPVRFRYKQDIDPSGLEQYGLVAEEVAKVYPDLIANDADGHAYTVRYQFLAPMLLNEVQKQAREIAKQREQIATLTARLEQVEAAVAAQGGTPAACRAAEHLGVPGAAAASF